MLRATAAAARLSGSLGVAAAPRLVRAVPAALPSQGRASCAIALGPSSGSGFASDKRRGCAAVAEAAEEDAGGEDSIAAATAVADAISEVDEEDRWLPIRPEAATTVTIATKATADAAVAMADKAAAGSAAAAGVVDAINTKVDFNGDPHSQLAFAPVEDVVGAAIEASRNPELRHWWKAAVERLLELEVDAGHAVLVLDCMVKMGYNHRKLLSRMVDQIEQKYHGMDLDMPASLLYTSFHYSDDFPALVHGLPVEHKVKIILMDDFSREMGKVRESPSRPERDARKEWRKLEEIDMEEVEKEQFKKGRIKVKRMRWVECKPTRMRPGMRLRATLATELAQLVPDANPETLAIIAQVCAFNRHRLLHGDLQDDFHEALAKRVTTLDTGEVMPYALAFASAMRTCGGSEALRAWRRKLIPALMRLVSLPDVLPGLDGQKCFHRMLGGVRIATGSPSKEAGALELLSFRASRAAQLLICVATAKQAALDTQLFDGLTAPLQEALELWLKAENCGLEGCCAKFRMYY
eukprot:gnl/TRDRNA2_/TRDRNA2_160394_c2_seq1.p1 gnl/TRDRNA2_/TRDRNA2_160394_c2~~gnl/TRDRNA2_/TRDRNA2_160394_c2_seq1.p1  ORF type:complete len:534 (-),score=122.16 gnl/TRDRNA2_/TRDRNA2_160394_c2_seq1:720-2291(-)